MQKKPVKKRKFEQLSLASYASIQAANVGNMEAFVRMPRFFSYDCDTLSATFADRSKGKCKWEARVCGKRGRQVPEFRLVCGSIEHVFSTSKASTASAASAQCPKSVTGLLKSHLQKNVRRNQCELAVRTARELMQRTPLAFLRRLPVIMTEDASLIRELPAVIWLMCALSAMIAQHDGDESQVQLTEDQQQWLLRLVHLLASSTYVERVGHDAKLRVSDAQIAALSNPIHRDLLWSLKVRAAYGGMQGDVHMFYAAIHVWYGRFQHADGPSSLLSILNHSDSLPHAQAMRDLKTCTIMPNTLIKLVVDYLPLVDRQCEALAPEEFELACVDFHCSDIADQLPAYVKCPTGITRLLSTSDWKRLLWFCSSSVTVKSEIRCTSQPKATISETDKSIFAAYVEQIQHEQQRILRRILTFASKR